MSTLEQARWFSEQVQPHEPALRAYLGLMSSEYPDAVNAARFVRGLTSTDAREAAHLNAISQWIAGDWHGASRTLDQSIPSMATVRPAGACSGGGGRLSAAM